MKCCSSDNEAVDPHHNQMDVVVKRPLVLNVCIYRVSFHWGDAPTVFVCHFAGWSVTDCPKASLCCRRHCQRPAVLQIRQLCTWNTKLCVECPALFHVCWGRYRPIFRARWGRSDWKWDISHCCRACCGTSPFTRSSLHSFRLNGFRTRFCLCKWTMTETLHAETQDVRRPAELLRCVGSRNTTQDIGSWETVTCSSLCSCSI